MAESRHSTRRAFLRSAAAVTALPIAGCTEIAMAAAKEDPELEIFRLARELHAKVKAHHGGKWQFIHNQENGALFFIPVTEPRIVEFGGPGWYEVEARGPDSPTQEVFIGFSDFRVEISITCDILR